MKRNAFLALLAVGMTVVSTGLVRAQSDSLAGVWRETFEFLDGPRKGEVGTALIVYHTDGTLVGTEAGNISFDPPAKNPHTPQTGLVTSDDIGLWEKTGPNTFVYTNYLLFSDFSGKKVGELKVQGQYTLTPKGEGYAGYSFYEGEISGIGPFSGYVSNEGTRLHNVTEELKPPPTAP
jgi:hypothetical protein